MTNGVTILFACLCGLITWRRDSQGTQQFVGAYDVRVVGVRGGAQQLFFGRGRGARAAQQGSAHLFFFQARFEQGQNLDALWPVQRDCRPWNRRGRASGHEPHHPRFRFAPGRLAQPVQSRGRSVPTAPRSRCCCDCRRQQTGKASACAPMSSCQDWGQQLASGPDLREPGPLC